ncbi:hypothetical protein [Armatimonas sp.]|uniref:hypothetical protein n=1 Tax=Armatimonas sp. TaxID=1872638 RepID=UPI00286A9ED7|nr:hypothetical protein [Armatimonas sp.]
MSRSTNGCLLHCDGPGCDASVPAPVLLRASLATEPAPPRWLFVQESDTWKHYCPLCARRIVTARQIRQIVDSTNRELA